jgi:ABC-type dipeptide/oligopeptide/nickel transport system permease component
VLKHLIQRLLLSIPVVFAVLFFGFALLMLVPSDPAAIIAGENASPETLARIRESLGLDQPVWLQFYHHILRLAHGDLGRSMLNGTPTIVELQRTIGATIELALVSMLWAIPTGILLGVVTAMKPGGWADRLIMGFSVLGISTPIFMTGLLLIQIFGYWLGWLPTQGRGGPLWTLEGLRHIILPAFTLGTLLVGPIARMSRTSMLDVLNQDYIKLARSKGLSETRVLVRHGLRNALIPTITLIGLQAGYLLGGTVVTETIFAWPGVGRLALDAIAQRDEPIMQGVILVIALIFVAINIIVDLVTAALDPRRTS